MTDTNSNPNDPPAGGGDKGAPAAWYEGLADDLKGHASVTRYASAEDAARALVHFNGHFGVPEAQLLRLPKPDDAAGQEALWNRFGRPETPDKYDVQLPEGSPFDKDAMSSFVAHMHKAGPFTGDLAKAAMAWYADYAKQVGGDADGAIKAQRAANEGALKKEWGAAYDDKYRAASVTAEKFGGEDLKKYLDDTGLGDDPRVIKAWAAVAEAMGEAGPPPDERGRDTPRPSTPTEAKAELAKIEGDEKILAALTNANDPQHAYWVERRLELIKQAHA